MARTMNMVKATQVEVETNSQLVRFLNIGRTFAAGGLLSVAVVNVVYDLLSKPLPDNASAWAVWIGGVVVVLVEKAAHTLSA